MAVTPPTSDELAQIAERYRLALDAQDVESFRAIIAGSLASYDAVERLYAARLPEAPRRDYQWPAQADNELVAWYVTSEIKAADDGPLAGRRVAIKDNIEVAGLPMMNGSATVEGYVPRRDATVVTRVLDAGATITGKAVCEDLCFSGGSHTSRSGPVRRLGPARGVQALDGVVGRHRAGDDGPERLDVRGVQAEPVPLRDLGKLIAGGRRDSHGDLPCGAKGRPVAA